MLMDCQGVLKPLKWPCGFLYRC